MKKLASIIFIGVIMSTLVSCGDKKTEDNPMTLEEEDTVTTIQKGEHDTLTIEIDKSSERLESEIRDVEAQLDSL